MKTLTHILLIVVTTAGLFSHASPVIAGPRIEVSFEPDTAGNQKLIHAQAEFAAQWTNVYNTFECITTYPMLHDWIRKTTLVNTGKDSREYLVEFTFPWPVGSQWSRVEVTFSGNTIFWKQLEGSLQANHGRIRFTSTGSEVHIDYRAAMDIGLPEIWTKSYKVKFVREFLTAAYEHSKAAEMPSALMLTAEP